MTVLFAVCFIKKDRCVNLEIYSQLQVERKLLYDVAVCVCCILYVKSCKVPVQRFSLFSEINRLKKLFALLIVLPVLPIRDILVLILIRILGSVPLTNSRIRLPIRLRILLFSLVTFKMDNKFFGSYFLKLHLHHFSKIKNHK